MRSPAVAHFASISAVGRSVERFLTASFQAEPPVSGSTTAARLVRTEDFEHNALLAFQRPFLSVFVYRVDFNKTTRAGWSAVASLDGRSRLPLDLHLLLTPWANDADSELRVLGRAMQALDATPILSGPLLFGYGDFAPGESVQLVLEDLSSEVVMRAFDSLPIDYKLSVPYIARVVRLDSRVAAPSPPVLTVVAATSPGAAPPPPSGLAP
jgi:hypothetical protein